MTGLGSFSAFWPHMVFVFLKLKKYLKLKMDKSKGLVSFVVLV